jgi:hypothetical protein
MAGKFGYDWETRVEVVDVYLVPGELAGTKTVIE